MLAARTQQTVDADATRFASATPFRHAVIDGFFEASVCESLLREFPGFDRRFALNEMGEVGGKAVRSRVTELGPGYAAVDRYIQSPPFLDYVSRLTGIPDLLYDPDYEGGGTHENRDGQSLDVHVDFNYHPRSGFHRRLNLIVYLNPEWDEQWGGALKLVEDPWSGAGAMQQIAPLFNRCVVFETTETSWHGFEQIALPADRTDLSRKSFAIYLYTRERPPEQTAAPHATVYVPDGMPDSLAVGAVLDAPMHTELRVRYARLRGQLRYMYEREKVLGSEIVSLRGALQQARAAQRIDLQGYARVDAVAGAWPDGWVSSDLQVGFTPSRALRELSIDAWVPPQLQQAQVLRIDCSGQSREETIAAGARRTLRLPLRGAADAPVALRVLAAHAWQPAKPGSGGDERRLAWRLIGMRLEH